jgi:hypothetical protein
MANSHNVFTFLKEVLALYRVILNVTDVNLVDDFILCIERAKGKFKDELSVKMLDALLSEVLPILEIVKANFCKTVINPLPAEECSVYINHLTSLPPASYYESDDTVVEEVDDQAEIQTIKIQIQLAEVPDAIEFEFDFDFEDQ